MAQGTIKTYDPRTHSGVVVDDARREHAFTLESFHGTGTREFRLGQRVKYRLDDEGGHAVVRDLRLVTL